MPSQTAPSPDATVPAAPQSTDRPAPPDAVPDPVLAAAVELARGAAVEVGGRSVGDHGGVHADGSPEDGPVATHTFASTDRAYVGWHWAVTVARAVDSDVVTVDEVVLLPGQGAVLAPAWLPWSERVQPDDLAAGDLLPPAADDDRLVPAYADPEAGLDAALGVDLVEQVRAELGLGRPRVLSVEGRADAAERWWAGEPGPTAARARHAPGRCLDCGFLVLLAGGLRGAFGVCANGQAPDDGRVVALAHGCGAHSETVVDGSHAATAGMAVQDEELELTPVDLPPGPRHPADEQTDGGDAGQSADEAFADADHAFDELAGADDSPGAGAGGAFGEVTVDSVVADDSLDVAAAEAADEMTIDPVVADDGLDPAAAEAADELTADPAAADDSPHATPVAELPAGEV